MLSNARQFYFLQMLSAVTDEIGSSGSKLLTVFIPNVEQTFLSKINLFITAV